MPYTTGYKKRNEDLPVWDPSEFEKESFDVRIFKLHGSVNWGQYFDCPPPHVKSGRTGDTTRAAQDYIANYPERLEFNPFPVGSIEPPERTMGMVSVMNFGTRKELLYASSQFTVLFNYFLKALNRARVLVVAGYSFRDERIKGMIEEAVVSRNGDLHVVIVDSSVFSLVNNEPLLYAFRDRKWISTVDKRLGEALGNGYLYEAVERVLKAKRTLSQIVDHAPAVQSGGAVEERLIEAQVILKAWRILGTTLELIYFWMRYLGPELSRVEKGFNESEAQRIGSLLKPLTRKIRDLCHHIHSVYEEMHLGSTYGAEYLQTIKEHPAMNNDFSHLGQARKYLSRLSWGVGGACNAYHNATADFTRALTESKWWKEVEAPDQVSGVEIFIRETKNRIYELVWLLNDIYKYAGYEEPFGMIAKHQAGSTQ